MLGKVYSRHYTTHEQNRWSQNSKRGTRLRRRQLEVEKKKWTGKSWDRKRVENTTKYTSKRWVNTDYEASLQLPLCCYSKAFWSFIIHFIMTVTAELPAAKSIQTNANNNPQFQRLKIWQEETRKTKNASKFCSNAGRSSWAQKRINGLDTKKEKKKDTISRKKIGEGVQKHNKRKPHADKIPAREEDNSRQKANTSARFVVTMYHQLLSVSHFLDEE